MTEVKENIEEVVEETVPAADKKEKKRRASKLRKEIETLQNENKQLKDQLLRKMAEFDNFRKRTDKEVINIIKHASEELIAELIPVIDDFERSLTQQNGPEAKDPFREGIELIYNKFIKALEEKGLKPMETDGKEFDPEIHSAMMQTESEDTPSNHIIQTFEKGYYYNEKVIRHAKVSVSK